jgi:metal-responsive CopG/Arc/MetJ family transcriptional regulator
MKRLNITLPEKIAQEIQNISNKSNFIAEAIKEKIEKKVGSAFNRRI